MVKQSKKKVDPNSVILSSFRKIKPVNRTYSTLKLYRNKQSNKNHQKTIHLKEGNIEHIARNFGNQTSEKLVKYVIAIRDTATEEIDFVETNDIFDIAIRTREVAEKHQISQPFYDPEHKRRLVQEFGTNKSKRKVNQMMSNIIK